jgi:ABC-type branched-subunit amino acid transport system ATPase component
VPLRGLSLAAPRKASVVAPGVVGSGITCPVANTLSGLPAVTDGQVKVKPPAVTDAPGVMPTAASA